MIFVEFDVNIFVKKYNKIILDVIKNKYICMYKNMYRLLNDIGRVSVLKV